MWWTGRFLIVAVSVGLSACDEVPDLSTLMTGTPTSTLSVRTTALPVPRPGSGVAPDAADAADAADGARPMGDAAGPGASLPAPQTGPTGAGFLGKTIGSLGDVTEPGMWAMTPLVSSEQTGRLETLSGKSVTVTLYPSGTAPGSGTQVSLGALRALGLSLADLPELLVYGAS